MLHLQILRIVSQAQEAQQSPWLNREVLLVSLGALLAGLIVAWFGSKLAASKKTLGYEILAAERLLAFKPEPGVIQIGVKTDIIKNSVADGDPEYTPVEDVYSFRVRLQNKGNEDIDDQDVFIRLDAHANVVSRKLLKSDGQDTDPRVEKSAISSGAGDLVRVQLRGFIPGEKLVAYIQSVGNHSRQVELHGPGISCFNMAKRTKLVVLFGIFVGLALMVAGSVIGTIADLKTDNINAGEITGAAIATLGLITFLSLATWSFFRDIRA